MNEIRPGVFHWSVLHEKIGITVHSCFLRDAGVLLDPMVPGAGLDALARHGRPRQALLTNRHHYRHSGRFAERFGVQVRCRRAGLHEFTKGERVEAFKPARLRSGCSAPRRPRSSCRRPSGRLSAGCSRWVMR
jgi:hypothetical protein